MPSQASNANLSFKIKLLSSKNVVLVDCPGFESELFMPQIIKGRINFQNIIPNHRCCDAAAANVETNQLILPASKFGGTRCFAGTSTPQRHNYEMQVDNISAPLARSTPANVKIIARPGKENVQALTPEQTRCKPTQNVASPLEIPGQHLESSSSLQLQSMDLQYLNVSDAVMVSPPRISPSSSLRQSGKSIDSGLSNFMHKAPPARTYSRRKSGTAANTQPKPPISWSPVPKKKKSSKVSSTKPLSPAMKLEVKQRKLIVDNKKSIASSILHKAPTKPVTKTKIRRMQVTGKTRAQFEALKDTAYDHLTTPGHCHVSSALTKQFKEACLDKYSETLPNYAELSQTAPLQMDRQVKTLMAKEKRLEKQMTKSQKVRIVKSKIIT
ncbi:uncharacterized protein LOC117785028 [Drosophila innubila]|uniref:uncharacterized protein LOC117785028 n=1 Tax=Drosophila innubila TaxID=198719 RepID=UPI00148C4DA1|nr:uncharacterized protein LOC117785028 [Drosophila innubila]